MRSILALVLAGSIAGFAAVTTAKAPSEVFKKGGPVRRLVENYPEVEAD